MSMALPAAAAARAAHECVVALDVGTGGTKASLVTRSGRVVASGFAPHPPPAPSPQGGQLSMEQEQEAWWSATRQAMQACLSSSPHRPRALAVTGQMQDVIMVPKPACSLTSRVILYSDTRACEEVKEIADIVGGVSQLATMTGSCQGASSVLAKLRWLDKHSMHAHERCQHLLLGGHDYVVWRLCGTPVTDTTTLSTTGLAGPSFEYADELIKKVGLEHWMEKLPRVVPSDAPCGEVTSTASEQLGLPCLQGLPVVHSCGDAGACTIGAGAAYPGNLYAYLGTSGWVAGTFARRMRSETELVPGVFTLGHPEASAVFKTGSIMTAGGNLAWASNKLCLGPQATLTFEEIDKLAADSRLGCGGLLYLPFLNGERCPVDNPDYRAAFIGISSTTGPSDMLRAVMEGVAFALRSARDAMAAKEVICEELQLVGGGARSELWASILCGVMGQSVQVLEDAQDVGAKGAALLAGKWLGWHTGLRPSAEQHWISVKRSFEPSDERVQAYNELYHAYTDASHCLRPVFSKLRRCSGAD